MSLTGLQLTAAFLLTAGLAGAAVTCALPMWKVSAFVGNNIVTAQVFWEGLWMSCVTQSTGQMQCKVYDSMLALPRDLQAARALTVAAVVAGALALLVFLAGAECTDCLEEPTRKARAAAAAGALAAAAGALLLVPASWSAHAVVRDFYDPALGAAQRRELGAALFVGWASAGLLLTAGALLCCRRRRRRDASYSVKYSAAGGASYV